MIRTCQPGELAAEPDGAHRLYFRGRKKFFARTKLAGRLGEDRMVLPLVFLRPPGIFHVDDDPLAV